MSLVNRDFWMGVFVGAAAGFVAAILTAPEPGENVRHNIRARGIELKEKAVAAGEEAQRVAGEVQRQAQELQRKAAQVVEQEVERVSRSIDQEAQRLEASTPEASDAPVAD